MANVLEILAAAIGFDKVRSELDDTAANTRAATAGMSDSFQGLAAESEAATQRISGAFVASAEATVALSRAKDQVRLASREAKTATDDEGAAIAKLALAQQQATTASAEMAAAQKAATEALLGTAATADAATTAEVGAFTREALGAKEASLSIRESMAEMSASFVEGAEAANLGGAGMAAGFSGISKLLGAGIVIGFFTHFIDEIVKGEVELDHLAAKTRLPIEILAGLRAVTEQTGASFEPFSQGLIKMEASVLKATDGSAAMILAFKRLGVTVEDLHSLKPEEIFFKLAAGVKENGDSFQVAGAGREIFAKGYANLAAVLADAGGNLEELTRKAAEHSGVTKKASEAAAEWTRDMAYLKEALRSIALEALPVLITSLKAVWLGFEGLATIGTTVFEALGTAIASVLVGVKDLAILVKDAVTGNWSALTADAARVKTNLVNVFKDGGKEIAGNWKALSGEFHSLFDKPPELPEAKKKDFGGDKEGKDTRLRDWQQELQQFRDAEDGFHNISKAEEASYWRDKLAIAKDSAELYAQVYHLARDAERQAQKQSFTDEAKGVEDKLKAERAGSLERVVILQEFLAHAKAIGADQTEEYKRLQSQLVTVTREFQEQQAKLVIASEEQKVAATRKGSEERVNAERDVLLAMQRLGLQNTTEYQGQLKKMIEATREWQTERGKLAQIGAEIEKSVEDHNFAERKKQIEFLAQTGQISKAEELRQLQALENEKFQIEYQGMVRRIQLASLDPTQSPEQVARLTQQLLKLEQTHELAVTQMYQQQIAERIQAAKQWATSVTSSVFQGFNSWITGQKSFAAAMAESWRGILLDTLRSIEAMVQKWIVQHLVMAAIRKIFHIQNAAVDTTAETVRATKHTATNAAIVTSDTAMGAAQVAVATGTQAAITAVDVAANATRGITDAAENAGEVTGQAGVAAARAYAAYAEFPPLAAAMAAEAFASVMSLQAAAAAPAIASAAGGMVAEDEQLAFVHKNEMVLPASLSRGFQNLLGGVGTPALAGGGSNSTHVSLHMNGGLVDKKFWDDHQGHIVSTLQKAVRKGRL